MAIVGIDIGTQSLKAVVCDDELAVLGEAQVGYAPTYPRPGCVEQDPGLWERAAGGAVQAALSRAAIAAEDVRAVGVAGQLDGCVPVDAGGDALGPCLIWMDRRAADSVPELPADFRARTGLVADGGHMAAKIRWLQAEGVRAARYHQPVSYLVARLTGAAVYDPGLASTTMLYRLGAGGHDPELCAAFGVDPDQLPVIRPATDCAGTLHAGGAALLGLLPETPVAVGTGDDFATPLGAGLVDPGVTACVLGTAEVIGALSPHPVLDETALLETHAYPGGRYFVENPGWVSGGALAWIGGVLEAGGPRALDALADDAPPGAGGLLFLPALSGAMAPEWQAGARGCFYGLTPAHGRAHLVRAVMEGCAFAMRDVLDRLAALGLRGDRLLLLGGGARSPVWSEMRAEIAGLRIEIDSRETCALGAAVLAAVAAERQPDLETAAGLAAGDRAVVEPGGDPDGAYADAHARYRLLFDSLRPMF